MLIPIGIIPRTASKPLANRFPFLLGRNAFKMHFENQFFLRISVSSLKISIILSFSASPIFMGRHFVATIFLIIKPKYTLCTDCGLVGTPRIPALVIRSPQSTVRALSFRKKKQISPNKINAALTSLAVRLKVNNAKLSTKIFTSN
jgi:hypothetical protein